MSIFAELRRGIVARTADEMNALAAVVAREWPIDAALALSGDLGAGKTTFVKGLAAAWRVPEAVTSPSFTLCHVHRGDRQLVHVDAYRLESAASWDGLMIEDFLVSPWCLVVEWPERVSDRLPPKTCWLRIEMRPDGSREIRETTTPDAS